MCANRLSAVAGLAVLTSITGAQAQSWCPPSSSPTVTAIVEPRVIVSYRIRPTVPGTNPMFNSPTPIRHQRVSAFLVEDDTALCSPASFHESRPPAIEQEGLSSIGVTADVYGFAGGCSGEQYQGSANRGGPIVQPSSASGIGEYETPTESLRGNIQVRCGDESVVTHLIKVVSDEGGCRFPDRRITIDKAGDTAGCSQVADQVAASGILELAAVWQVDGVVCWQPDVKGVAASGDTPCQLVQEISTTGAPWAFPLAMKSLIFRVEVNGQVMIDAVGGTAASDFPVGGTLFCSKNKSDSLDAWSRPDFRRIAVPVNANDDVKIKVEWQSVDGEFVSVPDDGFSRADLNGDGVVSHCEYAEIFNQVEQLRKGTLPLCQARPVIIFGIDNVPGISDAERATIVGWVRSGEGYCPADADCDGSVDGADVIAFLNAFGASEFAIDFVADIDMDGTVDGNDFIEFINAFAAGC